MLNKVFHLTENHTTVKTECIAGVTTFMTMAYILAVNPNILSAAGMDPTAVLLATCLASFLGTMCMGMMANLPFALSAESYSTISPSLGAKSLDVMVQAGIIAFILVAILMIVRYRLPADAARHCRYYPRHRHGC